jgi:hypothetical protein
VQEQKRQLGNIKETWGAGREIFLIFLLVQKFKLFSTSVFCE